MNENFLWQTRPPTEKNQFSGQFVAASKAEIHEDLLKVAEINPSKINSIEDLLQASQKEVTEAWQKKIKPKLDEFLTIWAEN